MKETLKDNMRMLVLFIIAGSLLTVAQSIITTGVVYLMSDFSVTSTQAQWSYSAFLLVVGVMMLINIIANKSIIEKPRPFSVV